MRSRGAGSAGRGQVDWCRTSSQKRIYRCTIFWVVALWIYNSTISLPPLHVLWALDDDPSGNVQHIAEHGVACSEVEEVLAQPTCLDTSRSTGKKIAIGVTVTGRTLIVVFDEIDAHTVYPITAYDLED